MARTKDTARKSVGGGLAPRKILCTKAARRSIASQPVAKRQRKNEDSLICCITQSLPVDPVVAEDGQIYEREAIEEYFKSKHGEDRVLSPVTRKEIRPVVFPAPQIKNHIETLIDNSAITGEPAVEWAKRSQQKKDMQDLLDEAEGGDVNAMEKVARRYAKGENGFQRDFEKAYIWYEKAWETGENLVGLSRMGEYVVRGLGGVSKDVPKGLMLLGMAEGRSSDLAAFILGLFLVDGPYGVTVDKVQGRRLLEKCLSGSYQYKNMSVNAKKRHRKS